MCLADKWRVEAANACVNKVPDECGNERADGGSLLIAGGAGVFFLVVWLFWWCGCYSRVVGLVVWLV